MEIDTTFEFTNEQAINAIKFQEKYRAIMKANYLKNRDKRIAYNGERWKKAKEARDNLKKLEKEKLENQEEDNIEKLEKEKNKELKKLAKAEAKRIAKENST